ncbi:uncharacterized protein [Epargyreus clarus]|uniref:uncharacterized protein isoform X2 n=1 Tax=Epargyreus clarus TaxID=520877 RepID=UPI003C2B4EDD
MSSDNFVIVKTLEKPSANIAMVDFPLTKSLGYTIGKSSRNTLEDARLNLEYIEQYQEVLQASQESFERVNGEDRGNRKDGRRQRHAYQVYSPVGKRRARSEALRREKLNSQSLRSHLQHTRQSSLETQSQDSNEYDDLKYIG